MRIYLDNAATTQLDEGVFEVMRPYFCEKFGNPNSLHSWGKETAKAVNIAREQVASALGANPNEIYFTGTGSEANNWAVKGGANLRKDSGNHIIVSAVEHHSVLNAAQWLKKNGFEVSYAPVDGEGVVKLGGLKKLIRKNTVLVSIMLANNEVGTIQPISEIEKLVHGAGALLHCDCVQACGAVPLNVKELNVDLATISAHKFYGPKGAGALYIKNGIKIDKLIVGGGQERAQRGGTTNTPAVVGMGAAIEKAVKEMQQNSQEIKEIRDYFVAQVEKTIPYCKYNGSREYRLPGNANFYFEFIEGDGLLTLLDFAGIAVSSGSACSSQSLEPSHVLLAMGVEVEKAHGSMRFSFGKHNTKDDADYAAKVLAQSVERLRAISPLFSLKEGEIKNV